MVKVFGSAGLEPNNGPNRNTGGRLQHKRSVTEWPVVRGGDHPPNDICLDRTFVDLNNIGLSLEFLVPPSIARLEDTTN